MFELLHDWSLKRSGAVQILLKLKDMGVLLESGREAKIYSDAIYDFLLTDPNAIENFVAGEPIHYRNHKRNPKGKLIYVEAYFE